ncbi:MAG: permease-like cell division protein FtsX [Patescibacteria group bacterium]|jgi:cell division transport system permease protein
MFLLTLNRSIFFALQSFWRNIWLSLATVFVIFLTLISVNLLLVVNVISDSAIAAVKDRIDVSVYFKPEVRESKVAEVKSHLEGLSQVKNITYRSSEDNLEAFKEKHAGDVKIQETLKELSANPMSATLVIKAKDLKDYPEILKAIDDPSFAELIEEKNYDDNQLVISRINGIADTVRRAAYFVIGIFALISILIIFNTVRVAIFTHQNEIGIMKLVGASNWFIRSPFILESVIAGIVAVFITIVFFYPLLSVLQPYVSGFFAGATFDLTGYFNANFVYIFGTELLAITAVNIVSSAVAIGKYLNV